VTEIHHINGAGEDAGVVYSEMQARENQSGDLMALQQVRLFGSRRGADDTGLRECYIHLLLLIEVKQGV
jgi:Zn-dependent M16 (insulinase) family peptidase